MYLHDFLIKIFREPDMQTLLMKKTERQQFELLKQLIRKPEGMTAQEITDYLHISLHAAYRYEKQLSEGLATTFDENRVVLFKENSIYKISIDKSLSVSYVIDKMSIYYIKVSQQFGLSRALFQKSYPSAESLAQEINLSLSHTYKILKRMNTSFDPFNISISFLEGDTSKNIIGDEKNIRLTMFYIYWAIYKGIEYPFSHTPKFLSELPVSIKSTSLSPSQKKRLLYFQTFTYWRTIYKKSLVSLTPDFMSYLELFEHVSPVHFPKEIQELLRKNNLSDNNIHTEEAYFGFLARFYIANIDSLEDKRLIVKHLRNSGLPLTDFAITFLDDFLRQFMIELSDENYDLVYYQLIFSLLYIQFFGVNVPFTQIADEIFPYKEAAPDLFDKHKETLVNYVYEILSVDLFPDLSKHSSLVEYLAKILYLAINSATNQSKLKLFIQYSKTTYGYDLIKNKLASIFSSSVLEFTLNIKDADIIISDSYEQIGKTSSSNPLTFYFEYPYDQTVWQNLTKLISQQICTKIR